jgi:hygromycin-B 7''-O-kinase
MTEFEKLLQQPERCLQIAQEIAARHDLPADIARIEEGSALVFSLAGQMILKIFAPEDKWFCLSETIFLSNFYRSLPIPRLIAHGMYGKSFYIVMEQLQGVQWSQVWDSLMEREQRSLICQLGELVRAVHSRSPYPAAEFSPFKWDTIIEEQRTNLVDHHRAYGLEPLWLDQLVEYVESCPIDYHDPARLVPLHTELMPDHLFVQAQGSEWRLTGLIDFEPWMMGYAEYEFAAVGLFITQGNRDLFRLFLNSYGYQEIPADLSRQIMVFLLLHRYSNLNWFLNLLPPDHGFTTLHQLEQYWYGI